MDQLKSEVEYQFINAELSLIILLLIALLGFGDTIADNSVV